MRAFAEPRHGLAPGRSLTIGNVYGHGFDASQVSALEAMGFSLRPGASVYAGSQLCRFIDFETGPSLELIEVTDRSDYASFVPPGMVPYCPGISLLVEHGAPAALDRYQDDFADLQPYGLHVPYRASGGPGWHYLNFTVPVLAGTFIWLTALDAPKPAPSRTTLHANGARRVTGLVFACTDQDLEPLARLAGESVDRRPLRIGGITVTATDASTARFPLLAVVLQADSLAAFGSGATSADASEVCGRPAVRVQTNPLAWELWITT